MNNSSNTSQTNLSQINMNGSITDPMTSGHSVLVLGATGGFGSELIHHMARQGWQVNALTRKGEAIDVDRKDTAGDSVAKPHSETGMINWLIGDLDQPASLEAAARNVDLIVHAVNVPYHQWDPLMVNYTRTIIALARDNQAQLMFVGNVYNAGLPANGLINEHSPNAPVNAKGELRAQLERMLKEASEQGVRTTIMRFGDFFGPRVSTSNWFNICTKSAGKNKLMFAGPADIPHTWAYLPDAVKAFERVAVQRLTNKALPQHVVLPFTGHVFSFADLQQSFESITGKQFKSTRAPWLVFKLLGKFIPLMREVVSMRYLWNNDIQMDGKALAKLLEGLPEHTPLDEAIVACLPDLKVVTHEQVSGQKAAV